jgi:glycosyltransferase involved in cell wall biosynthesis
MPNSITAVLLNYKRPENIPLLIQSIRDQSVPIDIWLVNNGEPANFDVDLMIQSDNSMKCYTRWVEASRAETEFVFSIDDDLMFSNIRLVELCVERMEDLPSKSIIGPYGKRMQKNERYSDGEELRLCGGEATIIKGRMMFCRTSLVREMVTQQVVEFEDDIYLSSFADYLECPDFFTNSVRSLPAPHSLCGQPGHKGRRNDTYKKYFGV